MPKKVFVRDLAPLPFDELITGARDGKISSTKRLPYAEFNVDRSLLKEVGEVNVPDKFLDANDAPGSDGMFYLITTYGGLTMDEAIKKNKTEKPPKDYALDIEFYG